MIELTQPSDIHPLSPTGRQRLLHAQLQHLLPFIEQGQAFFFQDPLSENALAFTQVRDPLKKMHVRDHVGRKVDVHWRIKRMQAMQKRISLIFLAGMCPQSLPSLMIEHRAERSRSEIMTLAGLMNLPFWLAWGERPRSGNERRTCTAQREFTCFLNAFASLSLAAELPTRPSSGKAAIPADLLIANYATPRSLACYSL